MILCGRGAHAISLYYSHFFNTSEPKFGMQPKTCTYQDETNCNPTRQKDIRDSKNAFFNDVKDLDFNAYEKDFVIVSRSSALEHKGMHLNDETRFVEIKIVNDWEWQEYADFVKENEHVVALNNSTNIVMSQAVLFPCATLDCSGFDYVCIATGVGNAYFATRYSADYFDYEQRIKDCAGGEVHDVMLEQLRIEFGQQLYIYNVFPDHQIDPLPHPIYEGNKGVEIIYGRKDQIDQHIIFTKNRTNYGCFLLIVDSQNKYTDLETITNNKKHFNQILIFNTVAAYTKRPNNNNNKIWTIKNEVSKNNPEITTTDPQHVEANIDASWNTADVKQTYWYKLLNMLKKQQL